MLSQFSVFPKHCQTFCFFENQDYETCLKSKYYDRNILSYTIYDGTCK